LGKERKNKTEIVLIYLALNKAMNFTIWNVINFTCLALSFAQSPLLPHVPCRVFIYKNTAEG
jgi:hypothetical protein